MPRHGALYRPARTHHQRRDPQALHPPESRRHVRRWSRHRQPLPPPLPPNRRSHPQNLPGRPSALNEYQAWVEQSLISNDLTHDQCAATCCSTKLASASAEPPGAAGYRDWDRREKKTIYARMNRVQRPGGGTWPGSSRSTRTGRCSWMRAASTSPRPRPTPTPPGTTCRG